jgi:hypothetical protein
LEWDFTDNVESCFIMIRAGRTVMMGALADGGAQQTEENIYKEYYNLALHPLQIREICARIAYRSMNATRVPKYITANSNPHRTWQMPLGGFSAKPLFEEFDMKQYAKILAHYTGYPIDLIYQAPDKVMTWLNDDNGNIRRISYSEYPYYPGDL